MSAIQQVAAGIAAGAASSSSAIVSGGGTSAANGEYTHRGTSEGKPYYNLIGQPDAPEANSIKWDSVAWTITNNDGDVLYRSEEAVAFPWLVISWSVEEFGTEPAPSVAPSTATAVVSGAGTSAANGIYIYRGFDNGKPFYNLVGQPDDPLLSSIVAAPSGIFEMHDVVETILYTMSGELAFPWLDSWDTVDGALPAPTVTQSG